MDPHPHDLATLWDIAGGSADLFRELVDEYITTAEDLLATLGKALSDGDLRAAERPAHTLKGSSGMVGVHEIHAACAALERATRAGDLAGARALFATLEKEHAATLVWLHQAKERAVPPE